jgi:RHS repeat-associated protein
VKRIEIGAEDRAALELGCLTRLYAYDEETNRISLTTRQPTGEGKCSSEGGSVESHSYDPANRLLDTGTAYDSFGNTAKLPAADAGGSELTSSFYVDNQLASQTQNGQTIGDQLDPQGRIREIVSTGKITASEIQHYPGPGSTTPSWTGELSSNYTRYITAISGGLGAIQHNGETPVLQLANLHGDIIATASDSETSTKLVSTISEASDYGVPATEAPPKYSWLGAHQLPTTLPSGVIMMGARSYIPQLGRFLQTDPVPSGSANAYAYTYGDPVNSNDPTGAYTVGGPSAALIGATAQMASQAAAEQAAINAAARAEAEHKAAEAASQAGYSAGAEGEGEEGPEEEWGEGEEWGEEYAAFGPGPGGRHHEAHTEGGIFQGHGGEAEGNLDLSPCTFDAGEGPCTRQAAGAAGLGAWWSRRMVPWCNKHPWAYYHKQGTYHMCQLAYKIYPDSKPDTFVVIYKLVKEIYGIAHCAYELWKQYGAGCGNP